MAVTSASSITTGAALIICSKSQSSHRAQQVAKNALGMWIILRIVLIRQGRGKSCKARRKKVDNCFHLCSGHTSVSLSSHTGVSLLSLSQTWEDEQYASESCSCGIKSHQLTFVVCDLPCRLRERRSVSDTHLPVSLSVLPGSSQFPLPPHAPSSPHSCHLIIWQVEGKLPLASHPPPFLALSYSSCITRPLLFQPPTLLPLTLSE